jgi:hypothetical protein
LSAWKFFGFFFNGICEAKKKCESLGEQCLGAAGIFGKKIEENQKYFEKSEKK